MLLYQKENLIIWLQIGPLKDGYKVEVPQSNSDVVPRLPMRTVALGPSSSGKSNLLVTLLTDDRCYKNKFEKIYWISPTARVDPS